MIHIQHSIIVKATQPIVWAFLSDFTKSLTINHFHSRITLSYNSKITLNSSFEITHNFGVFGQLYTATIDQYEPHVLIQISEKPKNGRGFNHTLTYELHAFEDSTRLTCSVEGSYANKLQNVIFKPVLDSITIKELVDIKSLIESSEPTDSLFTGDYNPI
jgi:hypothetical protein